MPDHESYLSRRRFLAGAGAAALAAFLSSCGRLPSPSPAPSRTPGVSLPTASLTPTQAITPTGPFVSPLASPSATQPPPSEPVPSATPPPPATPFPGGPPTKLGLFVAWYHPQIMDLIDTRNVALLKTMEFDPAFLADVRARSPETLIVGRMMMEQVDLGGGDALSGARRAVDIVLPIALDGRRAGLVDAWEGFNEPVPGDEDQLRKLSDLEVERVRLLAENGLRAVVGNFGTGHPPLEWWPSFRPALEAAAAAEGYLALHEYSAPTMWFNTNRQALDPAADPADEGWLTLRYRKVYRQYLNPWGIRLPLLITECGIDGLVTPRPGPEGHGWKDFAGYWEELGMGPDAPGNYIEQLAWYDRELQLDAYVRGATVFAMTAFQEWQSYQLLGEAAAILQQYLSVHPIR
jgi:hypothetical protein